MNVSGKMERRVGKAAFALALCAVLGGVSAWGGTGATPGDICSIEVTSPVRNTTVTAPGTKIHFTIRLGNGAVTPKPVFQRKYVGSGTLPPSGMFELGLRMSTGGWAYLDTIEPALTPGKTDCKFIYTVREGDLAMPLKIFGTAGAGQPGDPFEFKNGDLWQIVEANEDREVVWRFGNGYNPGQGDKNDWTLEESGILVQTLAYDKPGAYEVAATETLPCRIERQGTNAADAVSFYLSSGDTNCFQIVGADAAGVLALSIPSGKTSAEFTILGVTANTSGLLYLSQTAEKPADGTINWTVKDVNVTEAPEPTVKVLLKNADSANILTVAESDDTAQILTVSLTQAPATNLWVDLAADPAFIRLATNRVMVSKGQTVSDAVRFWALDDTAGVQISPFCPDPVYKLFKAGTVAIHNEKPVFVNPTETLKEATTLTPYEFAYFIKDVAADDPDTVTIWKWGDKKETVTTGRQGTVSHTYMKAGAFAVTASVVDGDGGTAERTFTVQVTDPLPKPFVSVIADKDHLSEASPEGAVRIALSETYPLGDVDVRLRIEYPDPSVTNIYMYAAEEGMVVRIRQGETNSVSLPFSVLDGTRMSQIRGVEIFAEPTNSVLKDYYNTRSALVYIANDSPEVLDPLLTAYTNDAPASVPRDFKYKFADIPADRPTIISVWDFGDGTPAVTNTGFEGAVRHTYSVAGDYTLRIAVSDKDDREMHKETLLLRGVAVGKVPTLSVSPEIQTFREDAEWVNKVTVSLSTPYDQAVSVLLTVSPQTNAANGRLVLFTTSFTFSAGETTKDIPFFTDLDGTARSRDQGFLVTASIDPGSFNYAEANSFYANRVSARVLIQNVDPVIRMPRAPEDPKSISYQMSQNIPRRFSWSVDDCRADRPRMAVTWNWGDGSVETYYGAVSSVEHTYTSFGMFTVTVTAEDKDGGASEPVTFNVLVSAAKTLTVIPLGPNKQSRIYDGLSYEGVPLGKGTVTSSNMVRQEPYVNDIYRFVYEATANYANLTAHPDNPYSAANTNGWNSWFYAWDDFDSGLLLPDRKNPLRSGPNCVVPMADSDTGGVYEVRAVFSREWRQLDNTPDINQDGIPDDYQNPKTGVTLRDVIKAVTGADPNTDLALYAKTGLADTNPDGDVNPVVLANGRISVTDKNCTPFTTLQELRGRDPGLNDPEVGRGPDKDRATDGPLDEPGAIIGENTRGTDPTDDDTDNDELPDGYEYYFWRNSAVDGATGRGYDPADPGHSLVIDAAAIAAAFNPLLPTSPNADTDGDGLTDKEEFACETNPIDWDTDGDGLPDKWEVMYGNDPLDPADARVKGNPDGDWMAFAEVEYQLVTLILDNGARTNTYLAAGEDLEAGATGCAPSNRVNVVTNAPTVVTNAPGDIVTNDASVATNVLYVVTNTPVSVVTIPGGVVTNDLGDVSTNAPTVITNDAVVVTNTAFLATNAVFYAVYDYGADLARGREADVGENWYIQSAGPARALLLHFQVYQEFGFDPRVAWGGATEHSRAFTAWDEFYLCRFMANVVRGVGTVAPGDWPSFTTNPRTPDTDATVKNDPPYDGMPDGWELYVAWDPSSDDKNAMAISPWNPNDGLHTVENESVDSDGDDLWNHREFGGSRSSAHYDNAALYRYEAPDDPGSVGRVTIYRSALDAKWLNKFWPTDPWNRDTDGDGLSDYAEQANTLTAVYPDGTVRAATWQYGSPVLDDVNTCFRGGGLNPCSADSDSDGLPDPWEYAYTGTNTVIGAVKGAGGGEAAAAAQAEYIESGMDGTYGPGNDVRHPEIVGCGDAYSWRDPLVMGDAAARREMDFDNDGLENYQEYLVQAMRHFRYDVTTNDAPMDMTFDNSVFFIPVTNDWDVSRWAFWPMLLDPFTPKQTCIMLPPGGAGGMYVSTDPRNPDTDGDGLDDYYEMFHGLNPILGSDENDLVSLASPLRLPDGSPITYKRNYFDPAYDPRLDPEGTNTLPMDFVKYPWMAGLGWADPDADGLVNAEERIQVNTAAPPCHNTDPSPMWMTDCYATNDPASSVVARFYRPQNMFFWDLPPETHPDHYNGYYLYSFEMNEGYDTDNDGVSDKVEALTRAYAKTDPQDFDDPLRRQALWFPGTNSAAEALMSYAYDEWAFRSFTLELWACPEDVHRDQVLLERPVYYEPSDLSVTGTILRLNFRVGILADGRVYAKYQNAGVHDDVSGEVIAVGPVLEEGKWVHIAARMDGAAKMFTLFLNGGVQKSVPTALIPANGVLFSMQTDPEKIAAYELRPALFTLGAAHRPPEPEKQISGFWDAFEKYYEGKTVFRPGAAWSDYGQFYKGYLDEVRIWDGARGNLEILNDYTRRYSRADIRKNRDDVNKSLAMGGTRIEGEQPQLPPKLWYHYSFDNLFGADKEASAAKTPRGFNAPLVATNRPAGYQVGWWSQWETRSSVYTDYGYLPWIENGVGHLANPDGMSPASRFWGLRFSGIEPVEGLWAFPQTCNPYGFWYRNDRTDGLFFLNSKKGAAGVSNINANAWTPSVAKADAWILNNEGDLLPLGGAWAKQAVHMWDGDAPSGVWAETGSTGDADSDGLPDWWEEYVATRFPGVDLDWNTLYPDGSGMTAGHRYIRDIALGYTETKNPSVPGFNPASLVKQTSDADGDGLPDWWENLYNLKSGSAEGDDGANGDPDRDGLSNYAEYLISEVYKLRASNPIQFRTDLNQPVSDYFIREGLAYLGLLFADHDMMEDKWEDRYDMTAVSRYIHDAMADADDDGWSNWAECRFGSSSFRCNPALAGRTDPDGKLVYEMPTPLIRLNLRYKGSKGDGTVVVKAWHDAAMNGIPDAIFTIPNTPEKKSKNIGYWDSAKLLKGWLSPGGVQPGTVKFVMRDPISAEKAHNTLFAGDLVEVPHTTGKLFLMDKGAIRRDYEVGSVDYTTGAFVLDLSVWDGLHYFSQSNNTEVVGNPTNSFITVDYQTAQQGGFPKTFYLTDADPAGTTSRGALREGMNYFQAYLADGGDWQVGMPFGVATPFGTEVGWDRQDVDIELRDVAEGQVRYAFSAGQGGIPSGGGQGAPGGGGEGDEIFGTADGSQAADGAIRVRIYRMRLNDLTNQYKKVVFDKVITGGRGYITEADLLGEGFPALDWGFPGIPSSIIPRKVGYEIYLGEGDLNDTNLNMTAVHTFMNVFSNRQDKAVAVEPKGYVYAARPTFKWKLPEKAGFYPAFTLQIRKSGATTILYDSGTLYAPVRTMDGVSVWKAPVSAGNLLSSQTLYQWRVAVLNARFSNARGSGVWSDWTTFRMDAAAPLAGGGYGAIKARVKYFGPVEPEAGTVIVAAYRNGGFAGEPESSLSLGAAETAMMTSLTENEVNARLNGLAASKDAGPYYVMAFIDQNGNRKRDPWESWGYANYYGHTDYPYDPKPVDVENVEASPVVDIFIEDADTDQDWYPDGWEYGRNPGAGDFLELTRPNATAIVDAEINPDFLSGTIDRTHLSAMSVLFNMNPGWAAPAGVRPQEPEIALKLTGLVITNGVPSVTVEVKRNGIAVSAADPDPVPVVLEFKEKLDDPVWLPVSEDGKAIRDGDTVSGTNNVRDLPSGFFRLRRLDSK